MRNDRGAQREALERAKEAAAQKDVPNFLRYIHESRFMDGARRRLSVKYEGGLDDERVHEVLTSGADRFYEAIVGGKKVFAPESYLWKIIDNIALDVYRTGKKFVSIEDVDLERRNLSDLHSIATETLRGEAEEEEEKKKREGVKIARSLLPKLGSENVQRVMGYIIDAAESGVEDLSSREISETLGMSETSVRKWRQRGFERIKRAAIEAGYRKEFLSDISEEQGILEEEE